MPPITGKPAPPFSLPSHDGSVVSLHELRGTPVVIYFYPADDTPGCTREACDFRDNFPRFSGAATVIGISPDPPESHAKFREKYRLPFILLSDEDHSVAAAYGVWGKKRTFGREYMGIIRTTFLVDAAGVLREIVPVPRVAGHAQAVLERLEAL